MCFRHLWLRLRGRNGWRRRRRQARRVISADIYVEILLVLKPSDSRRLWHRDKYVEAHGWCGRPHVASDVNGPCLEFVHSTNEFHSRLKTPSSVRLDFREADHLAVIKDFHLGDFGWIGLATVRGHSVVRSAAVHDFTLDWGDVVPQEKSGDVARRRQLRHHAIVLASGQVGTIARRIAEFDCDVELSGRIGRQCTARHGDAPCITDDLRFMLGAIDRDRDQAFRDVWWQSLQATGQLDLTLRFSGIDDVVIRDPIHHDLDAGNIRRCDIQMDDEAIAVRAFVTHRVHARYRELVLALGRHGRMHRVVPLAIRAYRCCTDLGAVVVDVDGVTGSSSSCQCRCRVVRGVSRTQILLNRTHVVMHRTNRRDAGWCGVHGQRERLFRRIA